MMKNIRTSINYIGRIRPFEHKSSEYKYGIALPTFISLSNKRSNIIVLETTTNTFYTYGKTQFLETILKLLYAILILDQDKNRIFLVNVHLNTNTCPAIFNSKFKSKK